jgi:ABC-2 type transport system ATP-binding protein
MCPSRRCDNVVSVIEVRELTKRYSGAAAVDGLTFDVKPGQVTGFLGPNGAGKTTTMRIILGLAAPDAGTALINGRRYRGMKRPLHQAGSLLEAGAVQGSRTALEHVRWVARSNGIPLRRAAEVLDQVGLADVAGKRIGGFSLGMKQRLGIATALVGQPGVLLFDEPMNGLDLDGVRWIRELMRTLAAQDRAILLSSHLMSEMELIADRLIIIGHGRLIADTSVAALADRFGTGVFVRSARTDELARALEEAGATVTRDAGGSLLVTGMTAAEIGDLAATRGIPVHEVAPRAASLEDAYLQLTADSVDYRAHEPGRAR